MCVQHMCSMCMSVFILKTALLDPSPCHLGPAMLGTCDEAFGFPSVRRRRRPCR